MFSQSKKKTNSQNIIILLTFVYVHVQLLGLGDRLYSHILQEIYYVHVQLLGLGDRLYSHILQEFILL